MKCCFTTMLSIVLLFILSINFTYAQHYVLKGKVVDKQEKSVEFASALLLKNDTLVAQIYTDSLGVFNIEANSGKYTLLIENFGQKILNKNIDLYQDIDLGAIEIEESVILDEMVIYTKKKLFERKVDRLVFNVENSVSASGGELLDALKVTPGVQVSNDGISIVGRSSVAVMNDDRIIQLSGESLINFLKSISADEIKSIEVITTPPAKYEAEGNSGLINIQYKKGAKNSWNNSIRSSYTQTTYPAFTLGNTFNYKKNRLWLVASFDVKKGNEEKLTTIDIDYPNQLWKGKDKAKYKKDNYSGRINADYQISDKSSIGAIILLNQSNPDISSKSNTNIYTNNQQPYNKIHTIGNIIEEDRSTSLNLNYRQKLDTIGRKMSVDIDYFNYKEVKSNLFDTKQTDKEDVLVQQLKAENKGNIDIQNFSGKIDFEHPANWADISYGAKVTFTKTNSNVVFYNLTTGAPILDVNQTDEFDYKENIQALYLDVAKTIGTKLEIKLGLRYEMTQTKGFSIKENKEHQFKYKRLFPSVYAFYSINDNNFLNFNYSRRISRPAFWELNPFRWYLNANSYSEGNPFLQPSYNDNFQLTYGYKQKWFSTLFTQIKSDGFSQLPLIDQSNYNQIFTRENYFTVIAFGLAQSYTFNKFKWLESNFQFSAFYSKTTIHSKFKNNVPPENGFGMNFSAYNSIVFNEERTVIGEVNYSYNSPSNGTIYRQSGSGSLDFGIKFLFLDKNLQVAVNIYDVLKTSNPDYTTYTNGIKQKFNTYYDNRFIRLSLRYSLGNKKIDVSQKSFGNEGDRDRIK